MNERLGLNQGKESTIFNETMMHLEKETYSLEEIAEKIINRLEPFCNNNQPIKAEENVKKSEEIYSPFITQLKARIKLINQTKESLINLSKRLEI